MDTLLLHEFVEILQGTLASVADSDLQIQHVATHSGQIRSRSAFFALQGTRDGHDFVPAAVANGAVAAVVAGGRRPLRDRGPSAEAGSAVLIEVDDPLAALQRLAAWWRGQVEATVVAVAGSNGKTTTKDALVHLAANDRSVYASPGSYNSQLGVALAILECPRSCDLAVVEVAISDPGEMARLETMLRPNRVVVTNLGWRWLSHFGDRAQMAGEMLRIAHRVPSGGWVLFGQDDADLRQASGPLACERFVAGSSAALPRFSPPQHRPGGLVVDVAFPDGANGSISVPTPSEEILADFELAMTAAWLLGAGSASLFEASAHYVAGSTRMEIWRSPGGITIIRDVATLDPLAVGSAVRTINRMRGPHGRAVVVLSDPLRGWDDAGATAMAQVLSREGASSVYGLDVASHRAVADALGRTGGGLGMRIFPSTHELRGHLLNDLDPGDVALVQSPRDRSISDVSVALMESMAPTRLYLDLSALEENVATFRRIIGPSVQLMGVVKALAYGTDSINVSTCLAEAGVDFLGVSGADEGAALRRAGVSSPILVLLGTADDLEKMARYRLTPVVYSSTMLEAVLQTEAWSRTEQAVAVHVEVDTGMHRTGFEVSDAKVVIRRLHERPTIRIEGLMTHLACADDPAEDVATASQLARFRQVTDYAAGLGLTDVIRHAAATAATIRLPGTHFDMVRIGLGLYGMHPSAATRAGAHLTPIVGLVSRVVEIIDVPPGERVGYGGTWVAPPSGSRVGVVPAGYHDCVPRAFSNFGYVIVAGVRCPIVGIVSMDSMTIDISGCPEAHLGADVLIYGRHNDWTISLEEVSAAVGTIPYELMARIGPRVQRIFTRH
ncbi:MAG: alanine racemase [Acidimicrobiales bacterium]